jgi:hypothetical protein
MKGLDCFASLAMTASRFALFLQMLVEERRDLLERLFRFG